MHRIIAELQTSLDTNVTLFIGTRELRGSIGETEDEDVVVLHTERGIERVRADRIDSYMEHPYK